MKPSARAHALRFLARREHSMAELKQKLLARGHIAEDVADAISWCANNGFQSDERFAESLTRQKSARYGNKAIVAKLGQIPFPESVIPDEFTRAYDWIKRKYGLTYSEYRQNNTDANTQGDDLAQHTISNAWQEQQHLKAKIFRQLLSRGFSAHLLEKAWRAWVEKS